MTKFNESPTIDELCEQFSVVAKRYGNEAVWFEGMNSRFISDL